MNKIRLFEEVLREGEAFDFKNRGRTPKMTDKEKMTFSPLYIDIAEFVESCFEKYGYGEAYNNSGMSVMDIITTRPNESGIWAIYKGLISKFPDMPKEAKNQIFEYFRFGGWSK
jgi:hypothetical protein